MRKTWWYFNETFASVSTWLELKKAGKTNYTPPAAWIHLFVALTATWISRSLRLYNSSFQAIYHVLKRLKVEFNSQKKVLIDHWHGLPSISFAVRISCGESCTIFTLSDVAACQLLNWPRSVTPWRGHYKYLKFEIFNHDFIRTRFEITTRQLWRDVSLCPNFR